MYSIINFARCLATSMSVYLCFHETEWILVNICMFNNDFLYRIADSIYFAPVWFNVNIILLWGSKFKNIDFNPITTNDELSRLENLTFLWTWILSIWAYWGEYLRALRPMLFCVTLCPLINSNVQKQWKSWHLKG